MKRALLTCIAITVLLALSGRGMGAGVLLYQPSARSAGMGLTGVADGEDPWNILRNPSVLGAKEGFFFSGASHGAFFEDEMDASWLAGAGLDLKSGNHIIRVSAAALGVKIHRNSSCLEEEYKGFSGAVELNAENGLIAGFGITARSLEDVCYPNVSSESMACEEDPGWEWDYGMRIGYLHHLEDGGRVIAAFGAGMGRRMDMYHWCIDEIFGPFTPEDPPYEYRLGISLMVEAGGTRVVSERIGFEAPLVAVTADIEEDIFEGADVSTFRFGTELSICRALYLRTGVITTRSDSDLILGAGFGISSRRVTLRIDMSDISQNRYSKAGAVLSLLLRIGF